MKQMIYKENRKTELLDSGVYRGYKYAIVSNGTHPCAYVENKIGVTDMFDDVAKDVECHFGVNYVGEAYWDENDNVSYIGWDYAHCSDFAGYYTEKDEWLWNYTKRWTTEEIQEEVFGVIDRFVFGWYHE